MKIALIPPIPNLGDYAVGGIHLLLSHLFDEFPEYEKHYRTRSQAGDYVILDNSAHEHGKGDALEALLARAASVEADEVVIPDVLFDARGTVESARQALRWLKSGEGHAMYELAGSPRLMYVPQGDTRPEWAWCLRELMAAHEAVQEELELETPVVGISKDYYFWHRGLTSLIQDNLVDLRVNQGIDVHCLGWPTDLWALAKVQRDHPWVRSTDSAKPFVYAKSGILLEPGGKVPEYPRRDERYFHDPLPPEALDLAEKNIEVFKASATDELIGV